MAERRPFPPSPRRRALARRAGLHAASPLLVGGAAAAAVLGALGAVAGALAHRLGAALAAACRGPAILAASALPGAVLAAALPVLGAAAVAAALAHLAQTRGVWLPRRRIAGAPALEAGPAPRTRRAAGELAAAAVVGGVAFAWLWRAAPHLAALAALAEQGPVGRAADAPSPLVAGSAAALTRFAAAAAIAWLALGAADAVARHAALARALAMTSAEKRDDDRLASADPRWRAHRARLRRDPGATPAIDPTGEPPRPAGRAVGVPTPRDTASLIAGASLLVLGDGAAVAIAWDPAHRPVPVRTATGRGLRATQLVALARHHRVPIHRDPALAAALVDGDGPIPRHEWPRLAEIVAAVRGRDRRG